MKIAIIGNGKMGKEITRLAIEKGHEISLVIDENNKEDLNADKLSGIDVAFEFTTPATAVNNYINCFKAGIPVISGTTGWTDQYDYIKKMCSELNATFFYASNFSIGVNVLFEMNRKLHAIMNDFSDYQPEIEEIHHIHKKDSPSGTAITLAGDIIKTSGTKTKWVNNTDPKPDEMLIISKRLDEIPGTHIIKYNSDVDTIILKHEAKSRKGFATGALMAAKFIIGKKGFYEMKDLLKFY